MTTFYSTDGVVDHAVLAGLFDGFKQYVPDSVTFEVENGGDSIDAETGDLIGAWGSGTSGPIVCTGATSYSAPVGLMIRWDTGAIMSGHRLRGKTYIVPALSTCFNLDGGVDATILADISSHAASYVSTASGACIWNRPRDATEKKAGHAGGKAAVTSGVVSPKAAILRSRRD